MAIATKPKPKTTTHKKRTGAHHKKSKQYHKSYWPYIPMLAIIGLGLTFNTFISHPRAVLGWQQNLNQESLLLETNTERLTNSRQALQLNDKLSKAAQLKALDMVQRDYWSHSTPGGKQPWTFIVAADYQYSTAGENLAYGFTSAEGVLNGWMHSKEHKANLLDTSYSEVGFGVAQSPNFMGKGSQVVVVAMYGAPTNDPNTIASQHYHEGLTVNQTENIAAVNRLQASTPMLNGILVGMVGTLAILAVLFRHAIAWRKLIRRGEKFIIKHPALDMTLLAVAVVAVLLLQTAGFVG